MKTQGEKHVESLLSKLDKKQFFYAAEYNIPTLKGDLRPDFILVSAAHGLIVGEVKDYKTILSGSTQKELLVERSDGESLRVRNPQDQARDYATSLVNELKKRRELVRGANLTFPWQEVVVFPHQRRAFLDNCEAQHIFTRGITWAKEDLESVSTVRAAIDRLPWKWRLKEPIDISIIDILRGILNPTLIVRDAQGNDIGTLTILQEFLSTEALEVTQKMHVRLVRGVAGSGKTLVLHHRVRFLRERYPDQQMLVLTYNKELADRTRASIGSDTEVETFHRQCSKIFSKVKAGWHEPIQRLGWIQHHWEDLLHGTGMDARFVDDEIKWRKEMRVFDNDEYLKKDRVGRQRALRQKDRETINLIWDDYQRHQEALKADNKPWRDWQDIAEEALRILRERKDSPHRARYDVIFVDEAQDFAPAWIDVVKAMLKPNGSLFLCDDPTQSIFSYYSWAQKGLEVVGLTKILRVPFRNSRQIARAAHALTEADPVLNQLEETTKPFLESHQLLDDKQPFLKKLPTFDDEAKFVREQIRRLRKDENRQHYRIAVIAPKKFKACFDDLEKEGIFVDTVHRVKGLEFEAVYLVALCHYLPANLKSPDLYEVAQLRRQVFTMMTRARYLLTMTHHNPLPEYLKPILPYVYAE